MIKYGIEIKWDGSREFVAVDFARLESHNEIESTMEWWTKERKFVSYVTSSEMTALGGGRFELKIKYEKKRNSGLPKDAVFGDATIWLDKFAKEGYARWQESGSPPDKRKAKWKRVSIDMAAIKAKRRHEVTRAERNQELFRLALVSRYRCCAVSGETSLDALEAAHVVASSNNGKEVIGNGILLRADIHRLYDRGAFVILANGSLRVKRGFGLSETYLDMFKKARLPNVLVRDLFGR